MTWHKHVHGCHGVTDASSASFPDVSIRLQLFSLEFALRDQQKRLGVCSLPNASVGELWS